jgi:hypothetical protein
MYHCISGKSVYRIPAFGGVSFEVFAPFLLEVALGYYLGSSVNLDKKRGWGRKEEEKRHWNAFSSLASEWLFLSLVGYIRCVSRMARQNMNNEL